MSDTTNCPRTECSCPCLPTVTLDQAVIALVESIALQEHALSHILCAESQKMKTAMAMEEVDLCKLLEINDSATNMVHAVANLELVLNMLAEATTTEISKERKPRTTAANRAVAAQGGRIAGNTRREIEAQTGKRIVSPLTAKQALAEKTAEGIEHPEADTTE